MKKLLTVIVLVGVICAGGATAAEQNKKKLKVFLLSGQSNMVGHSGAHTMATLFNVDGPKDKELAQLVFGKDAKVSKALLDEQLARARKIDEMTGGVGDEKLKAMTDATEKAEIEAQVKLLKAAHDAYKEHVTASSVVSDRVYINSIADRNKKSGKLSVGYGGDTSKIGPEYSLGLSIAEQIDGPILLIKTSWGGKSLHYDFRPPSAGEYQLDEKQKASDKVDEIKQRVQDRFFGRFRDYLRIFY